MTGSTFYENRSDQFGGAIFNSEGSFWVTNSTLYYNNALIAGGGIENWEGTLTVSNSTLSANYVPTTFGGGIVNSANGTLHLQHTIIADSSSGGDCLNNGTLATNSNNLIEDGSCGPAVRDDPNLGPLTSNGGPTETMALGTGSPAIDAGDIGSCEVWDQRGVSRYHGSNCDIGAFESSPQLPVNSTFDPGDGTCSSSECTLREAVQVAAKGDTITFAESLAGGTITLESQIEIVKDLTIDGMGLDPNVQMSGNHNNRVFHITNQATAELNHLDILSGSADIGGGIDNNNSTLSVSNCRFDSNNADDGGAINNNNGMLTVADCTFSINGAVTFGGAINNHEGTVSITGSTFFGNFSGQFGGGIFNNLGTITVANSTFVENSAARFAGGIENYHGVLTISNSTFSDNSAPEGGGGILNSTLGILHLKNNIIADSPNGGDCADYGTLATNVNNLIEDGTCSPAVVGDPMLGGLADNGGPTQTMAIPTNSPAFNTGNDASCEITDQRGVRRPQGPHCDMGAFERDYFLIFLPLFVK